MKNEPIEIIPVSNGFIVSQKVGQYEASLYSASRVFQTMAELCAHIQEIYSHRCSSIKTDDGPEAA